MTTITEGAGTAQAAVRAEPKPKPTKKARVAPQRAHVGTKKGKANKKAIPPKKAPKATKMVKAARHGSKTSTVVDLLKRPDGATLREVMKLTGWQAHSVRGFLSGTVGKKMGLAVTSTRKEDGERTYSVKI